MPSTTIRKVEKRDNFKQYDEKRINELRDKMARQLGVGTMINETSGNAFIFLGIFLGGIEIAHIFYHSHCTPEKANCR